MPVGKASTFAIVVIYITARINPPSVVRVVRVRRFSPVGTADINAVVADATRGVGKPNEAVVAVVCVRRIRRNA